MRPLHLWTPKNVLTEGSHYRTEGNVRCLLEKERGQGMEYEAVVADALYDSADNRRAIHEEKILEGERVKAYIASRQKERWLGRFRYDLERDRVICPCQQASIGKSPHEQGHLYYFSVESCRGCAYGDECKEDGKDSLDEGAEGRTFGGRVR